MGTLLKVQCIMSPQLVLTVITIHVAAIVAWIPESSASERFIRLDGQGNPINDVTNTSPDAWPCVFDQDTGLTWEVKSRKPGLHNRDNTYSWFNPDTYKNGGLAGYPGGPDCGEQPCDTSSYVEMVNNTGWCNAHDWRLPSREELRSLVDYSHSEKGPAVYNLAFPNTATEFYWSVDPSATNPDEAWGIGFTFGYDYSYYKKNRVHVRLVRGQKLLAKRGAK